MEEKWNQEDVSNAVRLVAEKAATDHKFKQLALKDPAAAIKQVTGRQIPETTKFLLIAEGISGVVAAIGEGPLESKSITNDACAAVSGKCPCGRTNVLVVR